MNLAAKPLDAMSEQDLAALIGTTEKKTLDYKVQLPGGKDEDRKEFCADVSSFANSSGGHIIYGMEEHDGTATSIPGLDGNPDENVRRLQSMVEDGVRPRLRAEMRAVPLGSGKHVILLRTPRSWSAPHMVTMKGHGKFYARNSAGKYLLDVDDLRAAFMLSATAAERMRMFRADRVASIVATEGPVPLDNSAKLLLHLMPFSAFEPGVRYNINSVRLPPLFSSGWSHRYNLEGIVTFSGPIAQHEGNASYAWLYRSGIVEALLAHMRGPTNGPALDLGYERYVIEGLQEYLKALQGIGVEPPIAIFLTLTGVKGATMDMPRFSRSGKTPIDRDILLVPEVVIENYDGSAESILRPLFDAVWNAAGWPQDPFYDEQGNRRSGSHS